MNYKIEIEEVLQKVINVEANSLDEALVKVKELYKKDLVELNENDLKEVSFKALN